jgi:hypothetical protein
MSKKQLRELPGSPATQLSDENLVRAPDPDTHNPRKRPVNILDEMEFIPEG